MTVYVGTSEYGDQAGKPQYSSTKAGTQFNLMLDAFEAERGYRLTVNEANRTREQQTKNWDAYQHFRKFGFPWAPVAAFPFTSKHDGGPEGEDGIAFDIGGVKGAALSASELTWLHVNGPKYGILPIGLNFGESWHFEYHGGETITPADVDKVIIKEQEDDMAIYFMKSTDGRRGLAGGGFAYTFRDQAEMNGVLTLLKQDNKANIVEIKPSPSVYNQLIRAASANLSGVLNEFYGDIAAVQGSLDALTGLSGANKVEVDKIKQAVGRLEQKANA